MPPFEGIHLHPLFEVFMNMGFRVVWVVLQEKAELFHFFLQTAQCRSTDFWGGVGAGALGPTLAFGEWNGNALQYSCLENSMDGEAWQAAVHGVAKSRSRLKDCREASSAQKRAPPPYRRPRPVAGRAGTTRPANTSGQAVADAAGADAMAALGLASLLGRVPATPWRAASKAPGPGAEVAGRVGRPKRREKRVRPGGVCCRLWGPRDRGASLSIRLVRGQVLPARAQMEPERHGHKSRPAAGLLSAGRRSGHQGGAEVPGPGGRASVRARCEKWALRQCTRRVPRVFTSERIYGSLQYKIWKSTEFWKSRPRQISVIKIR